MEAEKKNIAFVIGTLSSGGAERVISSLSDELINRYNIIIITFVKSIPFYNLDSRIKVVFCTENSPTPTSIIGSLKLNYKLLKNISKTIKSEKINIIIGFITTANILTVIASKINNIPCIISERNNPLNQAVPKFWVILRRLFYPCADKVVLQTEGIKKLFQNKIKPSKINILANPISSELSSLKNKNIARKNIILTVGRLDKNKGHDVLINAYSNITANNWEVIIIGNGSRKQELESLIIKKNLSEKIKIISHVKNIHDYYNEAGIFVFTSRTEGFPNALLEAMHFGIPCISTDCEFGPAEIINDKKNGYLIPVDDQTILEDRLNKLIIDSSLRANLSVAGELSTEKYSSKVVLYKWEELINSFF